jgi:deoxyribodipyrimidine photo-lyase
LEAFVAEGLADYAGARDRMDLDGTSRLSPYLRFGMLSAREAVAAAREAGATTWLDELIWREFYAQVLYHHPRARRESFREKYRDLAWSNDKEAFEAWQRGRTGYPIVDAGMRQLEALGWMHNRARMIVASFLTKDLLIDWRWGECHFMQQLVDGDPAANNGNWQWVAGTGTDAAPYFRIFNPVTQGKKHDPEGAYVKRWVPELADVPVERVHEPWTLSREAQREAGCVIGEDYPAPIVDHNAARERALATYKRAAGKG